MLKFARTKTDIGTKLIFIVVAAESFCQSLEVAAWD
jgi:hypothetical protein